MQNQKYSCYLLVSIFSRINSLLGATMRTREYQDEIWTHQIQIQ